MIKLKTSLLKRPLIAFASGVTGAVTLTLVHEAARRCLPNAPRMDVLGMRVIAKGMSQLNEQPPNEKDLFKYSLVGDIISNSLYYSLIGTGRKAWWRGAALGLAAGLGGVLLPGPLGLGEEPSGPQRTYSPDQGNDSRLVLVGRPGRRYPLADFI
jgi:hypothetical protein